MQKYAKSNKNKKNKYSILSIMIMIIQQNIHEKKNIQECLTDTNSQRHRHKCVQAHDIYAVTFKSNCKSSEKF